MTVSMTEILPDNDPILTESLYPEVYNGQMQTSVQEQVRFSPAVGSGLNSLPSTVPPKLTQSLCVIKGHRRGCFLSRNRTAEAAKPHWETGDFSLLRSAGKNQSLNPSPVAPLV